MTALLAVLGRGVARAFGWLVSLFQAIVIAIVTVLGLGYHSPTVRIFATVNAVLLVLVPLASLAAGVFLFAAGLALGNDWIILLGGGVLIGGTLGTFLLLVPGLLILSVLIAIVQGLLLVIFGGIWSVYDFLRSAANEILRPWRWLWTPRPVIATATATAPAPPPAGTAGAATATASTTRPPRP